MVVLEEVGLDHHRKRAVLALRGKVMMVEQPEQVQASRVAVAVALALLGLTVSAVLIPEAMVVLGRLLRSRVHR